MSFSSRRITYKYTSYNFNYFKLSVDLLITKEMFCIPFRLSGEVNTSPCESESTSNSPPSLLQDGSLPALLVSGASTLFQSTTTTTNPSLNLSAVDSLCLPGTSEVESCSLANGCTANSSLGGLALPLTSAGGLCSTSSSSAVAWLMNEDSAGKNPISYSYSQGHFKLDTSD